ncbi:MAG TPA: hypothetical protein VFV42_10765 [Acidimicrobiales bacterium]|nr:hypothetical protein [Acidimicrobiales bacterium]
MSEHRDPVVGDALRRLDVPDHGPDFWATLEAAMGDVGGPERDRDDPAGADVIELDGRRAASRRTRSRRLPVAVAAAAAAAALALGVGLPALQQSADGERQIDMAEGPRTTESADTTLPEATGPAPEVPAMTAAQAEANAVEWLDRLFAGDIEGAYGLLDDTSRAAMSFEDFELLGSGLFEGAAAFAGEGIQREVLQVETAAGAVSVVTFSGEVEREGMVEAAAYPVVVTPSGIHYTLDGPQLEIDSEYLDASGMTLTSPLVMRIGEDVPEVWVWTVGGGANVLDPVEGRGPVEIDVEATAGPGTHLVTLLAVQGDRIVARSHTVVVP